MERERDHHSAPTVTDLKYHWVWKPKYRYQVLSGEIALRTRDLLRSIGVEKGLSMGTGHVRSNHLHLLIHSPTPSSPAKIAQYLKGKSSSQRQREFPELRKKSWGPPLWGRGYVCATVGAVTEEQIVQDIQEQDDHPDFLAWDAKSP